MNIYVYMFICRSSNHSRGLLVGLLLDRLCLMEWDDIEVMELFVGCLIDWELFMVSFPFVLLLFTVIAFDLNPARIEMARENARIYGVEDRIQFIVGDFMQHAPFIKVSC
jgi:methylase of polypeptide subunit release factors